MQKMPSCQLGGRTVLPAFVLEELHKTLSTEIESVHVFAAGHFNQNYRVHMIDGREVFLKLGEQCPADCFAAEASGLNELQKYGKLRIPRCYVQTEDFIAIEWLAPTRQENGFDARLAQGLAAQHSILSDSFGFPLNNYCGASHQSNAWHEDGFAFFAERRLLPQARRAFNSGSLSSSQLKCVERICARLPDLIPVQTPALLHGDLWRGNVLCTGDNEPALIDPACYYGWPEADLAMMQLFGGFNANVFSVYDELKPLPSGFDQRCPLYNLYHLMNHLNLFGQAYLYDVNNILRRFS